MDDTINYAAVYNLVKAEMAAKPVAGACCRADIFKIKASFPEITSPMVALAKLNPLQWRGGCIEVIITDRHPQL